MKPIYVILLAVSVVSLAGFWMLTYSPAPNPAALAKKALTAPDLRQRIEAAAMLAIVKKPDPTVQLRQVLDESKDADVVVQVLGGLSARLDHASATVFIAQLDHPTPTVRAAAYNGLLRFHGGSLPENLTYSVDGAPEERLRVARRLLEIDRELQANILANATAEGRGTNPTP